MPSLRYRPTLLALMSAWLGVIAFATHLLLSAEIGRWERNFESETLRLSSEIKNKLDMNEAVLSGFAAFLQAVERNDMASATRYAASAMASYPHIYMLEVARQVPLAEQAEFQSTLRREWLPSFTLKDFPAITQRPSHKQRMQNHTWPILFMYPSLPEAEEIFGVRLETVDYLGHSLALAHKSSRPVVSPIFKMFEGGNAYMLLKEVDRSEQTSTSAGQSLFGNTMTALLLIKTESMLPGQTTAHDVATLAYQALMTSDDNPGSTLFVRHAEATGTLDKFLLPRLNRQILIDNASQPTLMRFEQQLRWRDLLTTEFVTIFALLACALVSIPAITLRHYKALERGVREHERSAYLATHDLLTGLPNRFLFLDRFEQAVQQHVRNANSFGLLLIDLDHFKEINDSYGHEVGDEVLVETAKRMTAEIRACDTVARHGGDEFVILLANMLNAADAQTVGEKLLAAISAPLKTSAGQLQITGSIGVAIYPEHGTSLDAIRRAADQAMYQAKKMGRNMVSTPGGDPATLS